MQPTTDNVIVIQVTVQATVIQLTVIPLNTIRMIVIRLIVILVIVIPLNVIPDEPPFVTNRPQATCKILYLNSDNQNNKQNANN